MRNKSIMEERTITIGLIALGLTLFFFEATRSIAPVIVGFGIGYLLGR